MSLDSSTTPQGVGDWKNRKVVLIASSDHGVTWTYVGKLTDFDDAGEFGYLIFTGTSLATAGKNQYLLATPAGKKGLFVKNRGHDGLYVIKFQNIARAQLERDSNGKLIVRKMVSPDTDMHSGGIADYHEQNTSGGIVFSQLSTQQKHWPEFFQVYNTGERIRQ